MSMGRRNGDRKATHDTSPLGMVGNGDQPSNKPKPLHIAAICVAIILVTGMCLVAYMAFGRDGKASDMNGNPTLDASGMQGNGMFDRNTELDGSHSTSEVTTNLKDAFDDNEDDSIDDSGNQVTDNNGQGNESADDAKPFDSMSKIPTFARETFDSVDREAMKQRASDFMTALMTFDSGSLANGSWQSSVSRYVDADLVERDGNPTKNFLIPRCTDERWAANCSTYPDFFSKVEGISNVSIYASAADKGYDFVPIKVLLTAREYRCEGDIPANDNNWQMTMRYDTRYEVSMTSSGQVYRVVRMGKTLVERDINGWGKDHNYGGKTQYADNLGDPGDDTIPD